MSGAVVALAPKLTKLVLLLGSDKPGEVVAAAAAIGRTLHAGGADWHDLAEVISRPGPEPTRPPAHSRLRRWQDIAQGDRAAWLGVLIASQALSEWERSFCVSVRALIVSTPWKPLSAKQVAILDRVVAGVS